jgi:DNA-binding response OmpR family regulator
VEDNYDVRRYIISHLDNDYRILEAVDGEEGMEQSQNHIPDLVISDVMMPKMDGFTLCSRLKNDQKTSHIPVIMLTAKAASQDKIEGYETGADDYIMKPFEAAELKVRIKNLIETRRKLQEKFSSDDFRIPKELNPVDEQFLKRVLKVINAHISEEEFSIEELGIESGMSRGQVYKKIKALTGKSPSLFLRSIRLSKARKMLKGHNSTIAEIAYSVGFSSPAYFTKCFNEEFGYNPSGIIKS